MRGHAKKKTSKTPKVQGSSSLFGSELVAIGGVAKAKASTTFTAANSPRGSAKLQQEDKAPC